RARCRSSGAVAQNERGLLMRKRSLSDLIVGAARGEPLSIEEAARLDAALARDPEWSRQLAAQRALGADLAALRDASAALPVPGEEAWLEAAFRRARVHRIARDRRRRVVAGAAAALVAVAGLGAWLASNVGQLREPNPAAVAAVEPAADAVLFQALPGA